MKILNEKQIRPSFGRIFTALLLLHMLSAELHSQWSKDAAENNVIVPEYVINERGEYPTDEETAWQRFNERKAELIPKMRERYIIPSDFSHGFGKVLLGVGF
ncbi:hypothetical protein IH922_07075, partial [candidate division KSB1 bacterium]|nr:hypothetical protein [candidate division KSB1 bacterium]